MAISFYLLARSLKTLPIDTAYAKGRYKMTTNTYNYIAEANAGQSEKHRLELQNEIFGPGTQSFLCPLLQPGMNVLVVGCGTGEETCLIAKSIGPTGSVVAIDLNEQQLQQAEKKIQDNGITNVTLQKMDLMDLSSLPCMFDLAFSRLVLIHIRNPAAALQSILSKLKPGGRMACEETVISAAHSIPPRKAFIKHIELLMQYGQKNGVDFDLGCTLKKIFMDAGMLEVTERISQPITTTPEHKRIVPMSIIACSQGYLKNKLSTKKEIDELVIQLDKEIVNDPECVIKQVEIHQVTGLRHSS